MENRKKIVIYTSVIVLFLLYLHVSTGMILVISGHADDVGKKQEAGTENRPVVYGIDTTYSQADILKQYCIQGWAFTADADKSLEKNNNINKKINLYLLPISNQTVSYPLKTATTPRKDIFDGFINKVNISGQYHGFLSTFSTLELPDDIYQLCIETIENKSSRGFAKTDIFFEKKGNSFERINYNTTSNIPTDLENNEAVRYGIDSVAEKDGILTIDGWGLYQNSDVRDQTTYLVISSKGMNAVAYRVYNTTIRPDLSEALGVDSYRYAGFSIKLPDELKSLESFNLQVVIETGGHYYSSTPQTFTRDPNSKTEYRVPQGKWESLEVSDASDKIVWAADNISIQGSKFQVVGWAANLIGGVAGTGNAYLEITGKDGKSLYRSLVLSHRADITLAYGQIQKENGFTMYADTNEMPSGPLTVKIVYKCGENTYESVLGYQAELKDGQVTVSKLLPLK